MNIFSIFMHKYAPKEAGTPLEEVLGPVAPPAYVPIYIYIYIFSYELACQEAEP